MKKVLLSRKERKKIGNLYPLFPLRLCEMKKILGLKEFVEFSELRDSFTRNKIIKMKNSSQKELNTYEKIRAKQRKG
ncbi:MAG: hypothetical protein AB1630_05120 [bacterium]